MWWCTSDTDFATLDLLVACLHDLLGLSHQAQVRCTSRLPPAAVPGYLEVHTEGAASRTHGQKTTNARLFLSSAALCMRSKLAAELSGDCTIAAPAGDK